MSVDLPAHGDEPPPSFGLETHTAGDATVVALTGELDILAAPEVGAALEAAQAPGGTVVLDLRELRFLDSSGLRVILEAHRRATDGGNGARLLVASGDGEVRRVLDLSGVAGLVELVAEPPG